MKRTRTTATVIEFPRDRVRASSTIMRDADIYPLAPLPKPAAPHNAILLWAIGTTILIDCVVIGAVLGTAWLMMESHR